MCLKLSCSRHVWVLFHVLPCSFAGTLPCHVPVGDNSTLWRPSCSLLPECSSWCVP
jgi:hypothetical protein